MNDSVVAPAAALRPLLKWAGGKRWLRARLGAAYAPYRNRRLVEPFCGALGVALGLRPRAALLNDINPHVVNFHRQVQRGLRIRLPMRNERAAYDAHRAAFNALIAARRAATKKGAALFYYLNRTGYNGLVRFNRRGEFNVPFGRHVSITYRRDFADYAAALAGWEFSHGDFAALELRDDDFVYADPPYDVEFRQYAPGGFDWPEQERLAHWLAAHPGPVVASNQATARICELYGDLGFTLELLAAPRSISRTGDRTPAREMLAWRGLSGTACF